MHSREDQERFAAALERAGQAMQRAGEQLARQYAGQPTDPHHAADLADAGAQLIEAAQLAKPEQLQPEELPPEAEQPE